jgi:hypothetical protein
MAGNEKQRLNFFRYKVHLVINKIVYNIQTKLISNAKIDINTFYTP